MNLLDCRLKQLEGTGWSKGIHHDDYKDYISFYGEQFDKEQAFALTYRYRDRGSGYRWLQECTIPHYGEDESFQGYLVMGIDITALKEVKDEFEKALQNAADLSDIPTALLVCKTQEIADIISDSVKVADALVEKSSSISQQQLASMMRHAGESLLSTIASMIDFTGLDSRPGTIRMHRVQPLQVLQSTLDVVKPVAKQQSVTFDVETTCGRADDRGRSHVVISLAR